MLDIDELVKDCIEARTEDQAHRAVREVLERAVQRPGGLAEALPDIGAAGINPIHATDDLTVAQIVWAPGMHFRPHNHEMWACIGIFGGQEDNTFYRRGDDGLTESGGRSLRPGDVAVLGADTIHAVTNPSAVSAGAIHVYGGNILTREGRSEWLEPSLEEIDYEFDNVRRTFEAHAAGTAR